MIKYEVYTSTGDFFGVIGPLAEAKLIAAKIGGTVGKALFTGGTDVDIWEDIGQTEDVMKVTATDILTETKPGQYVTVTPGAPMEDDGTKFLVGEDFELQTGSMALAVVPAAAAVSRFGTGIWPLLQRGALWLGTLIGIESLVPGETLPLIPGAGDIVSDANAVREVLSDLAPGGLVPGERRAEKAVLARLSQVTGVQITKMTHLPQGGFMGSYLPSPGARKKRGFYVGPGGAPVRTWANRGMAVISRDPRGSALAKGAAALDKATSRFLKAERVERKITRRVRKRPKR